MHLGGYVSRSGTFQHKITGVNGKVSPLPWIESDRLSAWGWGPIFSPIQFSRLGRLYRKLWIVPGAPRAEWAIPDFNVSKLSPPSKGGRAWYHSALCANYLKNTKKHHARSTMQPCMTLSCILEMNLSLASLCNDVREWTYSVQANASMMGHVVGSGGFMNTAPCSSLFIKKIEAVHFYLKPQMRSY